jgi:hypothetical protein
MIVPVEDTEDAEEAEDESSSPPSGNFILRLTHLFVDCREGICGTTPQLRLGPGSLQVAHGL